MKTLLEKLLLMKDLSTLKETKPENVNLYLTGSGPSYNAVKGFLDDRNIDAELEVDIYENLSLVVERENAIDLTYTDNVIEALQTLFPEEELEI